MVDLRRWARTNQDLLVSILVIVFTVGSLAAVYVDSNSSTTLTRTIASGLYQGMLYFMVAAGLSIIFGLMDVLNFAQGALFMIGAYVGFDVLTSLPDSAAADNRLLLVYVATLAPMLAVGVTWLGIKLLKNPTYQSAIKLGEWLTVIVLLGTVYGFLVGGNVGSDLGRILLAVLIIALAWLNHTRSAVLFSVRWLASLVAAVVHQTYAVITQAADGQFSSIERPTLDLPQWQTPTRPDNDTFKLGGVLVGLTLAAAVVLNATDILVVRLGIAGVAAMFAGAVAGVIMERFFIRPTYARPFFQIVLTFGLALVMREAIIYRYKREPVGTLRGFLPETLTGVIPDTTIFNYWVFMIIMGILMMIGVQLILRYTRIGIIIRAGVQDSEMVEALGINVRLVFTIVFALGAGIASLGGIISGGFLNIEPGLGDFFLLQAIAVVIVGGLGSYGGTAIASIMVGISRQVAGYFSREYYNTDGFAPIAVLVLLCAILLVKPSGLYGKEH